MDTAFLRKTRGATKSATLHAVSIFLTRPRARRTVLARRAAEGRIGVTSAGVQVVDTLSLYFLRSFMLVYPLWL